MDNNFWISSIMNYSQNSATEEVDEKDDCDKKIKILMTLIKKDTPI